MNTATLSSTGTPAQPSSILFKRFVLLVLVPCIALSTGLYFYLQGGRFVETDNAYIKAEKIPIASEVSGTIVEVFVKDNQTVQTGQPLFRIDDSQFKIAVAQAQARLDQVRSDIATLQANYVAKQAEIRIAKTNHEYAIQEQARQSNPSVTHYIPRAKQDSLAHNTEISLQKITLLEDELKQIVASGGNNTLPVEQHPAYLGALAELEQARLNMKRTLVIASRYGTISKPPKVGQYMNAGAAATMLVADDKLWIEANLTETDLTYVHEGQNVNIHVDTYPDHHWRGVVDSISPATGAEFSVIPAQNATGNWVKVAQRLTIRIGITAQQHAPQLRAGLSTHISIDTGHKRTLSELRPVL